MEYDKKEESKECGSMKEDIFDRLMHWPVLRIFEPFYKKHKEVLLYLLFGGLTTVVSIASFALFLAMGIGELVANVLSWVLAVLFAYVTNRTWVFAAKADTRSGILREIAAFFGGRVATLLVEEAVIYVFITRLHFPALAIKLAAQVLVVVLNYVVSKFFVFKDKKGE